MISEIKTVSDKICESCEKEFSCGAQSGACWCFETTLAPENLSKLKENFSDCLCRNCLVKYSRRQDDSK